MNIRKIVLLILSLMLVLSSCSLKNEGNKVYSEFMLTGKNGYNCFTNNGVFYLKEGFYNTKLCYKKSLAKKSIVSEAGLNSSLGQEYKIGKIYAYDDAVWVYVRKVYEKYQAIYKYSPETEELEPCFEIDNLTSSITSWLIVDSKLVFGSNAVTTDNTSGFSGADDFGLYYIEKDGDVVSICERAISWGASEEDLFYVKKETGEVCRYDFQSEETTIIGKTTFGMNLSTEVYYTADYLVLCKNINANQAMFCLFDLLTGEELTYEIQHDVSDFVCSENYAYYTEPDLNKLYKINLQNGYISEQNAEWLKDFESFCLSAASDEELFVSVDKINFGVISSTLIYRISDEEIKQIVNY